MSNPAAEPWPFASLCENLDSFVAFRTDRSTKNVARARVRCSGNRSDREIQELAELVAATSVTDHRDKKKAARCRGRAIKRAKEDLLCSPKTNSRTVAPLRSLRRKAIVSFEPDVLTTQRAAFWAQQEANADDGDDEENVSRDDSEKPDGDFVTKSKALAMSEGQAFVLCRRDTLRIPSAASDESLL